MNTCPFQDVRVVVLGQDPYFKAGQAMGLSFSVPRGVAVPSSLQNIYKELGADIGMTKPKHGNLEPWCAQGVLLLNSCLTVRAMQVSNSSFWCVSVVLSHGYHQAASHSKKGWEAFTDAAIAALSRQRSGLVFLLWGKFAQSKRALIDEGKHHVLVAAHPSGLSAARVCVAMYVETIGVYTYEPHRGFTVANTLAKPTRCLQVKTCRQLTGKFQTSVATTCCCHPYCVCFTSLTEFNVHLSQRYASGATQHVHQCIKAACSATWAVFSSVACPDASAAAAHAGATTHMPGGAWVTRQCPLDVSRAPQEPYIIQKLDATEHMYKDLQVCATPAQQQRTIKRTHRLGWLIQRSHPTPLSFKRWPWRRQSWSPRWRRMSTSRMWRNS